VVTRAGGKPFAVNHDHPARNLAAVGRVACRVADAVTKALDAGLAPLVVGGDCTITLGVIAGFRRHHRADQDRDRHS
jgi:arginase family enzyme